MNPAMQSPVGAQVVINGKTYDYFAGCGYLGLQSHPAVLEAAQQALREFGLSTATSRGGYGEHPLYDELEKQACAYFDSEKVLYFASGYLGMTILTQTGCQANDHLFIDAHGHYSLWEVSQGTNLPITVFPHRQVERLAELLKSELHPKERPVVLTDGVFPVSGEIAPVPDYLRLLDEYDGILYLDDAHAVGAIGKNGRGTLDHFQINDARCHTSGTLSKALGGWGGIIWGEKNWIETIDRNSRVLAGASPPPLPMAAASARALEIAHTQPELRQRLWKNTRQARQGLRELGWSMADSSSPIICLPARDGIDLVKIRDGLFAREIAVEIVRSYTSSPPGGALRIAIFATHTKEQIERLILTIGNLIKKNHPLNEDDSGLKSGQF
jgi:8-amino-7-oxononanoate synthase